MADFNKQGALTEAQNFRDWFSSEFINYYWDSAADDETRASMRRQVDATIARLQSFKSDYL